MRYSYDLFIRFLFSRRTNVNGTLESIGLPRLETDETKSKSLSTFDLPDEVAAFIHKGGDPSKVTGFMESMRSLGIHEMWEVQKEFLKNGVGRSMRVAWLIFSDTQLRTAYAVLKLSRFTVEEIEALFRDKYDINITKAVRSVLDRWFFDFSSLEREDWVHFVNRLDDEQRNKFMLVLKRKPKAAIEHALESTPNMGYRDVLADIMSTAYHKFKQAQGHPLLDPVAMRWAELAMKAGEKQVKYTKDPTKDLRKDVQMRFEFEELNFPTLSELPDELPDEILE